MSPLAPLCSVLLVVTALPRAQTGSPSEPDLRTRIELFSADVADLQRRYDVPMSGERRARLRQRFEQEQRELEALDFDNLPRDARVDWSLLKNHVRHELADLDEESRRDAEIAELVPFAPTITAL